MMVLAYIGIVLGALIGAYLLWMLMAAFVPARSVPPQPFATSLPSARAPLPHTEPPHPSRRDVTFTVGGSCVRGWFYPAPTAHRPAACVVMAHGLGGTMSAGLEAYAVRFQAAGFSVLAFDYRHLGGSDGEPRQLIWIPHQLADYAAAVRYVRSLAEVDATRVALWGTSLSGGHVLVTAARDSAVACVTAQCPLIDGRSASHEVMHREAMRAILSRTLFHGVRDLVRSWFHLSPHRIPIVGKPGTTALMPYQEAWDAFEMLASADFHNEACARISIRIDKYRPIRHLAKIECPVLLQVCEHDAGTPLALVEKAERRLGDHGQVARYPIDHFDIYVEEHFERAVNDQVAFFQRHLGVTVASPNEAAHSAP